MRAELPRRKSELDTQFIKEARFHVKQQFGSDLAEKATEDCVLTLGRKLTRSAGASHLESFALTASPPESSAVVVEFERDLDRIGSDKPPPSDPHLLRKAAEVMRELAGPESSSPVAPATLLRHARITQLREDFYKVAGSVNAELERKAGEVARPGLELATSGGPSPINYTCWLNSTIRTAAEPTALAEVASDNKVTKIDVPRRLEAELDQTSDTVGAPDLRTSLGTSGRGVIVAIIDSEVYLKHPALQDRVIHRRNYTKEPWGNPADHGTAVAGIVGANGPGLVGIAPEVTIYNYKILAGAPALDADDFFGARGIQDALEDGAHVANCSWGAGLASEGKSREAVAADTAWALGMVIVKSAGNRGPGDRTITTPAEADGVIAVGATSRDGSRIEDYSSRGPAPSGDSRPHLVAPGGSPNDALKSLRPDGGSGPVGHGTSFAAPHVTGLVALLLEKNPASSPEQIRDTLIQWCTPLSSGSENEQGAGLVSGTRFSYSDSMV